MTATDKSKVRVVTLRADESVRTGTDEHKRSVCGPTGKNQGPINLSPNSETVNFICNAKIPGTLKTSTEVTVVCHNRFSDQGQNSAIILRGCAHK